MKKYRLKKSAIIFMFLILIFIIAIVMIIFSLIKNKSYSVEYNIDDFNVSENYISERKEYYYEITYEKVSYAFMYPSKLLKGNKLIKDIDLYTYEDYTCLTIESDNIESNPLCSYNGEQIDYRLSPVELELPIRKKIIEDNSEYENYTIYNKDENILIWNYKGFNYINKDKIEKINIFNKDIYNVSLLARVNNYVIIPDYEQSYTFNKIYIINLDNLKVDTWKIKYDISFESYILGTNNKSIFLVDKKNKIEYELVPSKKKMRINAQGNRKGIIYLDGELDKQSVSSIINTNQVFTYQNDYQYKINNNKLYLSYLDNKHQILVSDNEIKEIVYINNGDVYYLVDDTLYKYNLEYGETKLVTFSEWKYNYQNSIIIYN